MREIRFAWVCRNIHFNEIERVELTDDMLLDHIWPSWITTDNCEILAKILPTGLKDRNGKEIWEGDIVRVLRQDSFPPYIAEVYYAGGAFCTYCDYTAIKKAEPIFGWPVEVIGNIHEHPELLKEQSKWTRLK